VVNASEDPRVARLWELCYLDPLAARELGHELAASSRDAAACGWLHVALAEVRVGSAPQAQDALAQARCGFAKGQAPRAQLGEALCDEVQAIALRRSSDLCGSAALQAQLDTRQDFERDAMFRFLAHNSRAITAKLLGKTDDALRHFYAACVAADQTGWVGPRITALSNLGGYHQDLYNLEDAKRLSEQAFEAARQARVRQVVTIAAANLIVIYRAAGEPARAREMVAFLLNCPEEQIPGSLQHHALNLAMGHLSVGEIDAALAYLEPGAAPNSLGKLDGDSLVTRTWVKARCLLARDEPAAARRLVEQTLQERAQTRINDQPYDMMELYRVQTDACERLGDPAAALPYLRRAQAVYEELVGRGARARFIALEVSHQLTQAQHERDVAVLLQRSAESDRARLAELNNALQAKIEETQTLHAQLVEQALRDPLTGLHNRRYLFEVVPGLLELARRQNSPLCVVLLDLDHFKLLNDTFGHATGDQVLKRFAVLLTETLRRSDVVSRHGGEEFVAVMPNIDAAGARAKIEQLLLAFQTPAPDASRKRMPRASFSAGIAVFPHHGHSLEQLLLRADRGLYAAKHQGRARVEMAPKTGFGILA
jgi:diguanylate cyclase (GGDEF)-like protein